MLEKRVLSIQSHVAYGTVGGRAAVFPLQLLGWDVDVVNTVNYSNHAGYGNTGGSRASSSELESIFKVMEANGLMKPTRLLTGYVPTAETLSSIRDLVKRLKSQDKDLIYVLDPVVGDSGKPYVPAEVIPVYRALLPFATIITPNWYEAELLTGIPITDLESLRDVIRILHEDFSVPHVIISSIPLKSKLSSSLPEAITANANLSSSSTDQDPPLLCVSSSRIDSSPTKSIVHHLTIPRIPGYFSGVGDLFSALVLSQYDPTLGQPNPEKTPLSHAVSIALSITHSIILATNQYVKTLPSDEFTSTDDEEDTSDPTRNILRMKGRELRLVQGQDLIRNGPHQPPILGTMKLWNGFWESR